MTRLGPQQRVLAQALHDGARLYRLFGGRWHLHDGETIRAVPGRRALGMHTRGLLMIDERINFRDRYALTAACERALEG